MTAEKQHPDHKDVDSDEHSQGKEIETGEENLPSKAAAVHEVIRMEGEKELERDGQALLWSAIAAGLSISASLMAKGILHARLPDSPERFFIENIGYTVGFIIVIMARQQLFTENTVTAVLPVMQKTTGKNILLLLRLWGIVLAGNVIGGGLAALVFHLVPFFDSASGMSWVAITRSARRIASGLSRTISRLSFSSTTTSRVLRMVLRVLATILASALAR